jgi:hypothetical protein
VFEELPCRDCSLLGMKYSEYKESTKGNLIDLKASELEETNLID